MQYFLIQNMFLFPSSGEQGLHILSTWKGKYGPLL